MGILRKEIRDTMREELEGVRSDIRDMEKKWKKEGEDLKGAMERFGGGWRGWKWERKKEEWEERGSQGV